MKKGREKLKAELLAKAEAEIEGLLDWHEANERPTFSELETEVLEVRRKLGQEMSQVLLEDQACNRPVPGPKCERCGQEMGYKGQKGKLVRSNVGQVKVERGYYYCQDCRVGFFPPR